MNTPGRTVLHLAQVGDREEESLDPGVVGGTLLPDLPMTGFFVRTGLVRALPERVIWSKPCFRPGWQAFLDLFDSTPFVLVLLWVPHGAAYAWG